MPFWTEMAYWYHGRQWQFTILSCLLCQELDALWGRENKMFALVHGSLNFVTKYLEYNLHWQWPLHNGHFFLSWWQPLWTSSTEIFKKLESFFLLRIVHYHVFRFSTASFNGMAFLFFLSFKPWCHFVILAQPHSHQFLELIHDWNPQSWESGWSWH